MPAAETAPRTSRTGLPLALAAAGAAWAALALLDPLLGLPPAAGPAASVAGLLLARRRRLASRTPAFLALLATVYALAAAVRPDMGADSRSYFVYLPSVFIGGDVDFADEFARWGFSDLPQTSPLRAGWHPVGPAIVWSPFFLLAHAYVWVGRLLGRVSYSPDGLSAPYVRSAAITTGLVAVAGAWLLASCIARRLGPHVAFLAVAGTALASPVAYYVLAQPAMAHGLVFGAAAALFAVLDRAWREPTRRRWVASGALLGLVALLRWQAVVCVLLAAPVAWLAWRRRRAPASWIAAAGAAAVAVFLPQVVVWQVLHGRPVVMPQGTGYVDWSSPHLADVLFSADRGLFTWTPVVGLGLLGLIPALRTWGILAPGALATAAATAWVNGGVQDWAGSDAFGARRFDLVVPLAAVGLATLLRRAASFVARRPMFVPAAAVVLLVAWNAGLMRLYRERTFTDAAPLDRLAQAQARQLRRVVEGALEALGGPSARSIGYRLFVGEYLYTNLKAARAVEMGSDEGRFLAEGWSAPRFREGEPRFRWAHHPEACLLLPLEAPFDLTLAITARAPRRLAGQEMTVVANGRAVATHFLGEEWSEAPLRLPAAALIPGENRVCLRFRLGLPGEERQRVAAAVARITLP